ncbi:hypothetical protein AC578_4089 [Pseudocercospora eumusae]|uniref:Uncharacterized protein n=1 Tax=Pseudocercospora eumusae TaxID=321146 RepID=A0A139HDL5_9PEZI|nr:hypothetical protein AC578_4089 [Pseudocercospora eumusae]
MKFHRSYAALEKQNRELRDDRDTLLTQLDAARKHIAALEKRLGRSGPSSTKPLLHGSVPPKVRKAVPRRTKGWFFDTTPFPSPSSTDYTKLVYDDGKLVDTNQRNAGYMKHTEASANKTVRPITALQIGVMYTTRLREEQRFRSEDAEPEPEPSSACSQDEDEDENEDEAQEKKQDTTPSLATRTRLNDPQDGLFYGNLATGSQVVQLPFALQMSLLQEGYDLTRQGTFDYIRKKWPREQLQHFPEHWLQIRFGRQELEDARFGRNTSDPAKLRIVYAMDGVISLRNILCHPSYVRDLQQLDALLRSAQELLVKVEDEERALKVRGLRDRVQEEAREIVKEIERREGLKMLPGDQQSPWPIHVQLMFESIDRVVFKDTWAPEAILRAAKEWLKKGYRVGEDEPDFQARVEAAQAWKRSMDDGLSERKSESDGESTGTTETAASWPIDNTTAAGEDLEDLATADEDDGWSGGKAPQSWAAESSQTGW